MTKTTVLIAATFLLAAGCFLPGFPGSRPAPPPGGGPAGGPPANGPGAQRNPAPAPGLAAGPSGQLVDCNLPQYRSSERPGALANRSGRPYRAAKSWNRPQQFPTAECTLAVTLRAQAYCQKPHVGYYRKELQRALTLCRAWDARRLAYQRARTSGGSTLLASMTPEQVRRQVYRWLAGARMARSGRMRLGYYALTLLHQPGNAKATAGFDQAFSSYYGVTVEVAARIRATKQYRGRLSAMPKAKLYQLAITELLGGLHKVTGDQPQLGLSYLDVLALLDRVYLPAIKANLDKFRSILCSRNLANARKDFRPQAVSAVLGSGICRPDKTALTGWVVLKDDRVRLALIEILAKHTANPTETVAQAALTIARQVGAKRTRVCWTKSNPMRLQKGVGSACSGRWARYRTKPKARRSTRSRRQRHSALNHLFLPRQPYYAAVYTPKAINQLTALEVTLALSIAKQAGTAGAALVRQLTAQARRAKKYKCLAYDVTMERVRRGRGGGWSKLALRGVGRNREVSCRKVRGNNALRRAMPKRWSNYYDTVRGGKYKGSWRRRRTFRKRRYGSGWYWDVRRTRSAVIYVRRKI